MKNNGLVGMDVGNTTDWWRCEHNGLVGMDVGNSLDGWRWGLRTHQTGESGDVEHIRPVAVGMGITS